MMVWQRMRLSCRRRRQRARAWYVTALIGLGLILLVVDDLPVVHDHDGPGLYNEECPLARLGTTNARVSVSSAPDLSLVVCAPETVPVAVRVSLASFSPAPFAPRAPPSGPLLPSRALIG
jgi:hypothetical protein